MNSLSVLRKSHIAISSVMPNTFIFNWILAAPLFVKRNGRLPRHPAAKHATVNDFIFYRMIANEQSVLKQFCADKEFAKIYAKSQAQIAAAKTIDVFHIQDKTKYSDFRRWINQFLGKKVVVKPTHSSGAVLFLDGEMNESDAAKFFTYSKINYFNMTRETHYRNLERKIIVELDISAGMRMDDYKFFCANGKALYCQIDIGRFTNHKRAIISMRDLSVLPVRSMYDLPDAIDISSSILVMRDIAETLSINFDFVRIDLYDVSGCIYFGEFTFAPGAASDNFSDEIWAARFKKEVMEALVDICG